MAGEQISKKLIQGPPRHPHPTLCFVLLQLRSSNGQSGTASIGANSRPPSCEGPNYDVALQVIFGGHQHLVHTSKAMQL